MASRPRACFVCSSVSYVDEFTVAAEVPESEARGDVGDVLGADADFAPHGAHERMCRVALSSHAACVVAVKAGAKVRVEFGLVEWADDGGEFWVQDSRALLTVSGRGVEGELVGSDSCNCAQPFGPTNGVLRIDSDAELCDIIQALRFGSGAVDRFVEADVVDEIGSCLYAKGER